MSRVVAGIHAQQVSDGTELVVDAGVVGGVEALAAADARGVDGAQLTELHTGLLAGVVADSEVKRSVENASAEIAAGVRVVGSRDRHCGVAVQRKEIARMSSGCLCTRQNNHASQNLAKNVPLTTTTSKVINRNLSMLNCNLRGLSWTEKNGKLEIT